jgi:hypothetical protein
MASGALSVVTFGRSGTVTRLEVQEFIGFRSGSYFRVIFQVFLHKANRSLSIVGDSYTIHLSGGRVFH